MKSGLIAWLATTAAVIAAAIGFILPPDAAAHYPAELLVLTATLIAIIWYTRYTFDALEHARTWSEAERTRQRQSLATGLLAEVKRLETGLRQVHALGPRGYLSWQRPVLDAALEQVTLLEPVTAERLIEFDSRVRQVELGMSLVQTGKKSVEDADREMKGCAALAVQIIPELISTLVREGGVMPTRRGDESIVEVPRDLPESPFGVFDIKRGWQ